MARAKIGGCVLIAVLAALAAAQPAPAEDKPMVQAYSFARQAVIPALSAFRSWLVSHNGGSKTIVSIISLSGDAKLLHFLASSKPTTAAGKKAQVRLVRLARDAASLGAFVDAHVSALSKGGSTRIPKATLTLLGVVYRDARTNWLALLALAPRIGA
jgi:hypothetical protein